MALHTAALLAAALSTCCVVIAREREWRVHALLSALMTGAMVDAALPSIIAPVYWTTIMLASALVVTVTQGGRRACRGKGSVSGRLTPTLLALIVMALLILVMSASPASADAAAAEGVSHRHMAQAGDRTLPLLAFAAGMGCAAVGAAHAFRSRGAVRIENGAMSMSMATMAFAVVVG